MTNVVLSNAQYKVVGSRPIRHDGTDKVTGRAKYGGDFQMAGMLHGKVLRSPHAHARVKSIDVSKALAYPGVKAVITGQDFPVAGMENPTQETRLTSDNVIARDKIHYKGHAVAAVAASSPHIAESALELIEVDYEVLQPVMNVIEAMRENAPMILEDLTTTEFGEPTDQPSNIATHFAMELGEVGGDVTNAVSVMG